MIATDMIPVVAYYRMSTDKQDTSIRDQRKAVEQYAEENGYKIVGEYVDEGVSGWKSEQRKDFQRLINDVKSGQFRAVLCWDQDRFSRFPVLEANHYWYLLDQAGVHLATVAQGRLNFDDLGEWLKASITQHGKAEYCKDLSRNVTRGLREVKMQGIWTGNPPYGYQVGDDRLLKLGDPQQVRVIQLIFKMRMQGHGYGAIANVLNDQGVKASRVMLWNKQSIRHILQRDAYRGAVVIGKHSRAQYHRVTDEPITLENTHPAIIDADTWYACQKMQQTVRKSYTRGNGEGAPLAGLLYCGRCGAPMYSCRFRDAWAIYKCSTYHNKGQCGHCAVDQVRTLDVIAAKIRDRVLLGSMDRLEEAIKRESKRREEESPVVDKAAIRRRLAALDTKITNATDRLVTVDASLMPDVEAKLIELKHQRADLAAELEMTPPEMPPVDAKAIAEKIWQLDAILKKGSPAATRAALSKIIDRVVLDFEESGSTAKRRCFVFTGGTIELMPKGCSPLGTSCCGAPGRSSRCRLRAAGARPRACGG